MKGDLSKEIGVGLMVLLFLLRCVSCVCSTNF